MFYYFPDIAKFHGHWSLNRKHGGGGGRSFIPQIISPTPSIKAYQHHSKNPEGGGGERPYEEHMGVCHELGSHFQEKIPKRACQFLTQIPRKGYNICKNFQIGSAILIAQMTNQMKTKLTDYFDLVPGLKIYNFRKIFENGSRFFSQNSPQNRILDNSIRHKSSEKGPTCSSKIPERVNRKTIQWHTPV